VDKKVVEYTYRNLDVLKRQLENSSESDPRRAELEARIAELEADANEKERKLSEHSKNAEALRLKKQHSQPLAGASAAPLNRKNKRKFKAHEKCRAPYHLKVQNVVSKAKMSFQVDVSQLRWLKKAKYVAPRFPAPSGIGLEPRVSWTHYASREFGCAGARSPEAALYAAYRHALHLALSHGEELQLLNFGVVNLTGSSNQGHSIDMKRFAEMARCVKGWKTTYERTKIDMIRVKEDVSNGSAKKGIASNTSPTGRVCTVGFSSYKEFYEFQSGPYRLWADIAARCAVAEGENSGSARQRVKMTKKRSRQQRRPFCPCGCTHAFAVS
jgi:TATA-box binding protein (TBP) (component of TFIID and TFIIIB)